MAILDVTAMRKDKEGIFAANIPASAVHMFRRPDYHFSEPQEACDRGPFCLMLELDKLPPHAKYLQITVDFNVSMSVDKGVEYEEIRIGQRGGHGNIVPTDIIAGKAKWSQPVEEKNNEV